MPACVRGYAHRRPGIFTHFISHILECRALLAAQAHASEVMPACVWGYAHRRPGISTHFISHILTFYLTYSGMSCSFGCAGACVRSLCQHASGVMPIGAQGFSYHFCKPFLQYRAHSGDCCASLGSGFGHIRISFRNFSINSGISLNLTHSLCQHASGVMPKGAWGFLRILGAFLCPPCKFSG